MTEKYHCVCSNYHGHNTICRLYNEDRDAELAPKPVTGQTFEEARKNYFVTNKTWTSGEYRVERDDAFLSGWNAALATQGAARIEAAVKIANEWKSRIGTRSECNDVVRLADELLRALGRKVEP